MQSNSLIQKLLSEFYSCRVRCVQLPNDVNQLCDSAAQFVVLLVIIPILQNISHSDLHHRNMFKLVLKKTESPSGAHNVKVRRSPEALVTTDGSLSGESTIGTFLQQAPAILEQPRLGSRCVATK